MPRYRVPDDIAWIDGTEIGIGESLYVTKLPTGKTVHLTGTARMIWLVAAEGGDVLVEVSELVNLPADCVKEDIRAFLDNLTHEGLLKSC